MAKVPASASGAVRRVMYGGAGVAAIGLAACGTVTANGGGSAPAASAPASSVRPASRTGPLQGLVRAGAGAALCADVSGLRRLTVTRIVSLPGHLRFSFPATVRLTKAAQARAVAAAACQQPQMPRVTMTCPADLGVSYRLAFAAPGRAFPGVTAAATGCAKLAGLGAIRQAQPGLWVVLGRAMGIADPSSQSFAGHRP